MIGPQATSNILNNVLRKQQLENEALGFVQNGWTTLNIKISLFSEEGFGEDIACRTQQPEHVPPSWPPSKAGELMQVEGSPLFDISLASFREKREADRTMESPTPSL